MRFGNCEKDLMTVKKIAFVCRHCEKELHYEKDFVSCAEV
jgi:hypothetical protein